MKTWHKVTNVREWLASTGRRNVGTHAPRSLKNLPWPVCSRCGLLYLKNDVTRAAIKAACVIEE